MKVSNSKNSASYLHTNGLKYKNLNDWQCFLIGPTNSYMNDQKALCFIGTSGIALPGNRQSAPAEFQLKSRLHYYSTLFNSIEINSSFYKIPMPATFAKWSKDVNENFSFTLKLWKEITHVKNLNFQLKDIDRFINSAEHIGHKKGSILIQFPGKITLDYFNSIELILKRMAELDPGNDWQKAFEFRHPSWYVGETYELLHEQDATVVLQDIPKSKNFNIRGNAPFYYFRFHGPKGDYRGSYSQEFLKEKSGVIRELLSNGKKVFAYFNNTAGNAFENAFSLQTLINERSIK
jgi:uncharacterized protein YecE (DUF72 family)